jgi:hypothetical protein
MAKIVLRGKEYEQIAISGTHGRLAVQYKNKIISVLHKLGVRNDDVKIEIPAVAFKKEPASASWWQEDRHMYYSCSKGRNYAENLHLVSRVIERYVNEVLDETIPIEEFFEEFHEKSDVDTARKEAREKLGLPEDTDDFELVNKTYRKMVKEHHPDTANGDEDKFKDINNAHKVLKRELT